MWFSSALLDFLGLFLGHSEASIKTFLDLCPPAVDHCRCSRMDVCRVGLPLVLPPRNSQDLLTKRIDSRPNSANQNGVFFFAKNTKDLFTIPTNSKNVYEANSKRDMQNSNVPKTDSESGSSMTLASTSFFAMKCKAVRTASSRAVNGLESDPAKGTVIVEKTAFSSS